MVQPPTNRPFSRDPREKERIDVSPVSEVEQQVTPQPTKPTNLPALPPASVRDRGVPVTKPKSYLTDDERVRFSQEGVDQKYDQQIRVEMSRARLSGAPINEEEALRRVMLRNVGATVNPSSGDTFLSPASTKYRVPSTKDEVRDYIALNYPSITLAAISSGLTEEEVMLSANVMIAKDAVVQMANSYNPMRRAEIINTMGPDMQFLTAIMWERFIEQGAAQAEVVDEQSGGNWVTDLGRKMWGYSIGPVLDAAWDANRFTVNRAIVSAAYSANDLLQDYLSNPATLFRPDQRISKNLETYKQIYEMTAPGFIDGGAIENAKEIYGTRTVDVVLEVMRLKLAGEEEAIGKLYQKYYETNDVFALSVLDNLISGVPSDPRIQDAATYLYSGEVGNLGNMMFWSVANTLGISPYTKEGADFAQTGVYTITRDVSNVAGALLFDPTLHFFKGASAYRMARFGLHKLAPGKPLEAVFKDQQVRNAFDAFGTALTRVDQAKDQAQAAQMMNSVNSQWARWFSADAIQVMRAAGVRGADSAYDFFRAAENLPLMISGQMARRGNKVTIPHMTQMTARVKLINMRARGLTYDRNAGARLDALFDAPVSQMLPEEVIPYIIERLASKDGEKFLGRMLSDFVFANETARRTFVGNLFDAVITRQPGNNRLVQAASRYGFKREPGVRPFVERRGRVMSRMPDLSRLHISDGRDARKIRDLLLYGGMPKYWADYSAMIWRQMDEGQRIQFVTGMGRSVAYARGIDVVDPVNGQRLIDNMLSGFRPGELYAPDQMDLVALRGMAERIVDDALAGKTQIAGQEKLGSLGAAAIRQELDALKKSRADLLKGGASKTDETVVTLNERVKELNDLLKATKISTRDERAALIKQTMEELKTNAPIFNPSKVADFGDATRGLYEYQFANQISFINFEKLDELSMRQSFLSALLGTNPAVTTGTDVWTLGTLAGPRFQVRNGIEDAIFYGITGGSWRGYRYGQLLARAKAEATLRPEKGARSELVAEGTIPARGGKLGVIPSMTRMLGDTLPNYLRNLALPHASGDEILAANQAAQKGDRKFLGDLIQKLFLRRQTLYLSPGYRNKQALKDLDDIYDSGYFWGTYDDASEASRHLIDGILPGSDNTVMINGQVVKTLTLNPKYETRVPYSVDPEGVAAWHRNLTGVLHGDGIKGTKAVSMIRRYYLAKRSGDPQKVKDVVQEFTEWMKVNTPWVAKQSGIVAVEGLESFAQRNLDDVLRLFTTKSGTFNRDLLKAVRRVEVDPKTGKEFVTYRMWDRVDGKMVDRVNEKTLIEMKGRPQTVLDMDGIKVPVTDGVPLNTRLWTMMGRSYARLTRQPMFIANYLDARKTLRPLEARLAGELGEEYAKKWAVQAATERAYGTLMSYVDNPIIRSQMAFNLRNVARFYRALEDFNRRMIRLIREYPEGIQKLNLAYRVSEETGFVHEDEFGELYFIWPGSRIALQTINAITEKFGIPISPMGGLPLSFSSRVTMLTPSADPDNWFPTFSGYYASAAFKQLMRITPGLDSLEEEFFGEYSTGKPVWESVLPTNFIRPLNLASAALAGSEARALFDKGAFASANRTAIQAAAAAGWIDPNKNYSQTELNEIRQRIDGAAMDFMQFRTLFGPIIPAAFSIEADTVSDFARRMGVTNLRKAFVSTLKAYEGDSDAALIAWMTANPDKSIFTVGTSGVPQSMGDYEPFKETIDFIESNKESFDKFPIGTGFFAPQTGSQQLAAWNYLTRMGARSTKSGDRYFKEIATSQGYALYRIYKKQYEDEIASGDEQRIEAAKAAWENAKESLNADYPLLNSRLRGRLKVTDVSDRGDYDRDVLDYKGAVKWMEDNGKLDERGWYAKQVLNMYDEAKLSLSDISNSDPNKNKHKTEIRESWMRMVDSMKSRFPDDERFEGLLFITTSGLGFRFS